MQRVPTEPGGQGVEGRVQFSATDLVSFLECEHLTALDLRALDDAELAVQRCEPDDAAQLVADKGNEHERRHLERLREQGCTVVDIAQSGGGNDDRIARTLQAMRDGVEVIYQARLG